MLRGKKKEKRTVKGAPRPKLVRLVAWINRKRNLFKSKDK